MRVSLLALFLLAACATQESPLTLCTVDQDSAPISLQRRATLAQWQAKGRLGLKIAQAHTAMAFHWTQRPTDYTIALQSTWIGGGHCQIQGNSEGVQIQEGAHKAPQFAKTPEALLQKALGWQLPLSYLPYWIRGVPHPLAPYQGQSAPNGNLVSLQQSGWVLEYSDYMRVQDGLWLPQRLIARHSDIELKMVIQKWIA